MSESGTGSMKKRRKEEKVRNYKWRKEGWI